MERSILGIKVGHVRNAINSSIPKITDVIRKAATLKRNYAGHNYRMPDDQWARLTTQWVSQWQATSRQAQMEIAT